MMHNITVLFYIFVVIFKPYFFSYMKPYNSLKNAKKLLYCIHLLLKDKKNKISQMCIFHSFHKNELKRNTQNLKKKK